MRAYIILSPKPNKKGLHSLSLKININRKPYTRKIKGIALPEQYFDQEKGQVKAGLKDPQGNDLTEYYNLRIGQALAKANSILTYYYLSEERELTREVFKRDYENDFNRGDFLAFWEDKLQIEYQRRVISRATKIQLERSLKKLKAFCKEIPWGEISRELIERYDSWHAKRLQEKGYKGARERERTLKHIKKYLRRAQKEGKKFSDPFDGFIWPRYKVRPVFISLPQLKSLIYAYRNPIEIELKLAQRANEKGYSWHHKEQSIERGLNRVQRALRCFIWQCITGMRDSDMRAVSWADIEKTEKGSYLVFIPQKTKDTSGAEVRLPLTPLMRELIVTEAGPLLQAISNQKYNDHLKELSELFNLPGPLSSHAGRHTFATLSLEQGISVECLRDLMGLTKIETLLRYVHITDKRRDREFLQAWGQQL